MSFKLAPFSKCCAFGPAAAYELLPVWRRVVDRFVVRNGLIVRLPRF
jgi:hypothetical protein